MAYIFLAKGKGNLFFWTEFAANAVLVGLTWLGIAFFGLTGMGMAFFGMYVIYWFLVYFIVKHLTKFTWSVANIRIGLVIFPAVGLVFLARYFLADLWYLISGGMTTLAMGFYSIKMLSNIAGVRNVSTFLLKVKAVGAFFK